MKRIILSASMLLLSSAFALPTMAEIQTVTMKTSKAVGEKVTLVVNKDGGISVDWGNGATKYTTDTIVGNVVSDQITITGNEYWTNLDCSEQGISEINLAEAPSLKSLFCQDNSISALSLTANTALTDINCSNNEISTLTLSPCKELQYLNCSDNNINRLTVSSNTALETLICCNNKITGFIGLNTLTKLNTLWTQNNSIKTLALGTSNPIKSLVAFDNSVTTLSGNLNNIEDIWVDNNKLKSLDLSNAENLQTLSCDNNNLTSLSFRALKTSDKMYLFSCGGNNLTYASFPTPTYVTNFSYAPQESTLELSSDESRVELNTEIDFSRYYRNASETAVGTYKVFDAVTNEELVKGSNPETADYKLSVGKITFYKPHVAYFTVSSSSRYPEVSFKSTVIGAGMDIPTAIDAVEVGANGIKILAQEGGATISSSNNAEVNVISTNGMLVWKGTASANGTFVSLQAGIYVANGIKFIIK